METPKFCNDSQAAAADAWKTIKISTSCRQLFSAHPKISNWKKQRGDRDGRVGVLLPKYVARRLTQFLANPHPRQREGWWVCWCQRRDYLPRPDTTSIYHWCCCIPTFDQLFGKYAICWIIPHGWTPLLFTTKLHSTHTIVLSTNEKGKYEIQRHGNSLISPLPPLTATYWSAVYLVWFRFWRLMLVFTILTSDHVLVSNQTRLNQQIPFEILHSLSDQIWASDPKVSLVRRLL